MRAAAAALVAPSGKLLTPLIALHEVLCLLANTLDALVSDALLHATVTWAAWRLVSEMSGVGGSRWMCQGPAGR